MSKTATSIDVCVFTATSKTKLFQYGVDGDIIGLNLGNLSEYEYQAFQATEQAANGVLEMYPDAKISWNICPYDYDYNTVVVEQVGFGQNLPAILITAYYDNDTKRQYPIANYPGGTRVFEAQEIYNKIRGLYEAKFGEQPLLCKLFPIVCDLGAYAWLAIAGVSTYKAIELKKQPVLATGWGALALFAGEAFIKGGGMEKIFKAGGPAVNKRRLH